MNKLLSILLLLCSVLATRAADIHLVWGPSPTDSVTNYTLFCCTNTSPTLSTNIDTATLNIITNMDVGTNLTATVRNATPGQWWFVVKAQADGFTSDPSNWAIITIPKVGPPVALTATIDVRVTVTISTNASKTLTFEFP